MKYHPHESVLFCTFSLEEGLLLLANPLCKAIVKSCLAAACEHYPVRKRGRYPFITPLVQGNSGLAHFSVWFSLAIRMSLSGRVALDERESSRTDKRTHCVHLSCQLMSRKVETVGTFRLSDRHDYHRLAYTISYYNHHRRCISSQRQGEGELCIERRQESLEHVP